MMASFSSEQRLEHAAVGVETGGEDDGVVLAEMSGDRRFELAVQGLRAADEADRGHAEAEFVHRPFRGGDDVGVIGEAEIIVGAEVERLARAVLARRPGCARPAGPASRRSRLVRPAASMSSSVERMCLRNASDMEIRRVGRMDGPYQRPPRLQTPQSMSASPRWIASASRESAGRPPDAERAPARCGAALSTP